MTNSLLISLLLGIPSLAISSSKNGFTVAAKYGAYDVKMPILGVDKKNIDSDKDFGITLGYYDNAESALELDYIVGTVILNQDGSKTDVDAETIGLYWTFRSKKQVYWISKLGYAQTEFKLNNKKLNESFDKFSYGVGGGYRISPSFSVEAELTVLDDKVFSTTAAVRWVF